MSDLKLYFIRDKDFFLQILDYITKFLDTVEVSIDEKEIIFTGIDPHDYCYVKATFPSSFFGTNKDIINENRFDIPYKSLYMMDVSILNKILPQLRLFDQVFLQFSDEQLTFQGYTQKIDTLFRIKWHSISEAVIPKPKNRNYKVIIDFIPNDLITAIKQVYSISNIMNISTLEKEIVFKTHLRGYSAETKLKPKFIKNESINEITTLSKYFKIISPAMKLSNKVKLFLMDDEPPKIELSHELGGIFEFYFSYKKVRQTNSRKGKSLPMIKASLFMEFLSVLNKSPDKTLPIHTLTQMKLETKGGDNIRFGKMLDLINKKRGDIQLTKLGMEFADELDNSIEMAKELFFELIQDKNYFFLNFFEILNNKEPKEKNQLRIELNLLLKEKELEAIDKRDIGTLINVGQWCNKIRFENGMISKIN